MREITMHKWTRLVAACEKSDLSINRWCKEQGISPSTYYKYRRELRLLEEEGTKGNSKWQALTIVPDETFVSSGIRLYITEKNYLEIKSGFDPKLLQEIIEVLRA